MRKRRPAIFAVRWAPDVRLSRDIQLPSGWWHLSQRKADGVVRPPRDPSDSALANALEGGRKAVLPQAAAHQARPIQVRKNPGSCLQASTAFGAWSQWLPSGIPVLPGGEGGGKTTRTADRAIHPAGRPALLSAGDRRAPGRSGAGELGLCVSGEAEIEFCSAMSGRPEPSGMICPSPGPGKRSHTEPGGRDDRRGSAPVVARPRMVPAAAGAA